MTLVKSELSLSNGSALALKPRLLFLRYGYEASAPRFLVSHSDEHVRCLSQHFDVTVVSNDCDYAEMCDRYEPDITLFEVGLQLRRAARLRVNSVHSNPTTPKIGLLNADPWGSTRSLALSDFDYLDLQAAFCIGLTTPAHFRDCGCPMFYWPNFIDPAVFRDHRQDKLVSVTLTGATNSSYPWRQSIFKQLAAEFPCIAMPHLGYAEDRPTFRMPSGVAYAKLINSAWVAPTCGSIAGELVRKHLEIPACRTALVTEDTPVVREAGFRDMENCVFVDSDNAVSRVADLLSRPDDLMRLIDAGHTLVHREHTIRNRTQIFEWFQLNQQANLGQRIIQESPFSPLRLVSESDPPPNIIFSASAKHLVEISDGYVALKADRITHARTHFVQALEYFDTLSEARLGLAICDLLDGRAADGMRRTAILIKDTLARHENVNPDPAEWAQLIVCHLCQGQIYAACWRATQYADLRHPDLDHIRQLLLGITPPNSPQLVSDPRKSRGSLHKPLADDFVSYRSYLDRVLIACGQRSLAVRIASGRLSFVRFAVRLRALLFPMRGLKSLLGPHAAYLPGSGYLRGLDNPLLLQKMFSQTQYFAKRNTHPDRAL